eukprot:GHVT01071790.1.p1 GENE.GHVT01071790.1~~GHVT01071790.1.p1  ORF type:complete len:556 (+),score=127.90 GHVT01071790.1:198-1670(+)
MAIVSSTPSGLLSSKAAQVFDLMVIGGGSGGMAAARRAAGYGKKVAVVEGDNLGGTCVNVGCVPKKVMWNAASIHEMLFDLPFYGFELPAAPFSATASASEKSQTLGHAGVLRSSMPPFDYLKLKTMRDEYIARLNRIYDENLSKAGISRVKGWASFDPEGNGKLVDVTTADKKTTKLYADHVLIATGSQPAKLPIPGAELAINSDDFFALNSLPPRVGIIGAGYIAVELAGVFHALGVETHLFVRGNMALRTFDEMIKTQLDQQMKAKGIHIHAFSVPSKITADGGSGLLTLHVESGAAHGGFPMLLSATGRTPAVKRLGLEPVGVQTVGSGPYIVVDDKQNTTLDGVFALGDVCGVVELTPTAIAAGRRLADRLYGGMPSAKADYTFVPTVIFSHPPIATVGYTEEEAAKKYGADAIQIYSNRSVNLYYGHFPISPGDKPPTTIKMICLKAEKDRVIGLHIVGMGADEMMQGFGVAIKMVRLLQLLQL